MKKPDVGLGVVGTNTLIIVSGAISCRTPLAGPVVNAIAHTPLRGYSTSTTRLNDVPDSERKIAWNSCCTAL